MLDFKEDKAISNNITFTFETLNKLKENTNNYVIKIKLNKLMQELKRKKMLK